LSRTVCLHILLIATALVLFGCSDSQVAVKSSHASPSDAGQPSPQPASKVMNVSLTIAAFDTVNFPVDCGADGTLIRDVTIVDAAHAVVVVRCDAGAGNPSDTVFAYEATPSGPSPTGTLVAAEDDLSWISTSLTPGGMTMSFATYTDGSVPRCCPDLWVQQKWLNAAGVWSIHKNSSMFMSPDSNWDCDPFEALCNGGNESADPDAESGLTDPYANADPDGQSGCDGYGGGCTNGDGGSTYENGNADPYDAEGCNGYGGGCSNGDGGSTYNNGNADPYGADTGGGFYGDSGNGSAGSYSNGGN
jgi:hypothetical protein